VTFDLTGHPTRIAAVEALVGRTGWLTLQRLEIDSFEREEYLLFSAFDDQSRSLDQETCEKLFRCAGSVTPADAPAGAVAERLERDAERHVQATISRALEANNRYFQEERERLEKWAEDMVLAAQKELEDTGARLKLLNRQARQAVTAEEQAAAQRQIRELERQRRKQRQAIFDVEDQIEGQRDELIGALEQRLAQRTVVEPLFSMRWEVK
jgi:hypothetical protein